MKVFEVTGKIRENPQQPGLQQAKVVKQTGNELTVAPQAQGKPTGTEVTVDLSKNPQAIQKDQQGNITVDPNAQPQQAGGMQLQPGQDINVVGNPTAPGPMIPNPNEPNQPAAEEMDDMDPEMVEAGYVPNGYNDDYREKAMMRKAMQNITQDQPYMENEIVALARRVSNIPVKAGSNQKKDILDIKKLAGL
ncbi:hypothetical protein EBU71_04460 [bacterium]|nr:hypothetical protein [Candidatus Elulimicrobium humile]